jgi:hypothetical protein
VAAALAVAGSFAFLLLGLTKFEAPEYDTESSRAVSERRRRFAFGSDRNDGYLGAADREQN